MNRRVALIAGGVAAAMFALWFVLLFRPQSADIDAANEREAAAASQNGQLEIEVARLQEADANKTELVAEQERLRVAVPDDAQLAQFILDANDAATAAGVDFLEVSPSAPSVDAETTGPTAVNLAINVEGGYFQVLDYMNRIDAMDRIVVIDDLGLAPSSNPGSELRLMVTIKARMFTTDVPATADATVPADPDAPADPNAPVPAPADGSTTTTVPAPAPAGDTTVLGSPEGPITEEAQ